MQEGTQTTEYLSSVKPCLCAARDTPGLNSLAMSHIYFK